MKPIFISYVRENEETVDKFCQELILRGLKVWLDRQDLNPGKPLETRDSESHSRRGFFRRLLLKRNRIRVIRLT